MALSREIQDNPAQVEALRRMLTDAAPESAEDEISLMQDALVQLEKNQSLNPGLGSRIKLPEKTVTALEPRSAEIPDARPDRSGGVELVQGVAVAFSAGRIELRGRAVTQAFRERLFAWIIAEQDRASQ